MNSHQRRKAIRARALERLTKELGSREADLRAGRVIFTLNGIPVPPETWGDGEEIVVTTSNGDKK